MSDRRYINHAAKCGPCITAPHPSGMCDVGIRLTRQVLGTFQVRGKRWRMVATWGLAGDRWAECDKEARECRIALDAPRSEWPRLILHEMLHAHEWAWTERRVDVTSTTMARMLTRAGFGLAEPRSSRRASRRAA